MGNFQGGNKGGFRGGNGGKSSFQKKSWGNDRGGTQMHKAICSDCGKTCEVPFRPSGDKPVFCNDCFSGKRDGGDMRGNRRGLDRAPKKDFVDQSVSRVTDVARASSVDEVLRKQVSEMNVKLDRLVNLLERSYESNKEVALQKTVIQVSPKKETKKTISKVVSKPVSKKVSVKKVASKKPVVKKKK
jgi:CxxC-x17-CxxC domain-containing protein